MRQIILDTETTGLDPKRGHRIIEIACVEMVNRRVTGDVYHTYINPMRGIDEGAQQVHGITEAQLADKPVFADIAEDFLAYVRDAELVIHNAPFDVSFINHELRLWQKKHPPIDTVCQIVDTLPMARKKHPGQRNNLDALCQRYEVDNSNRELHGALIDCNLLAQVYLGLTGGQTGLFGENTHAASHEKTQTAARQQFDQPFKVIKATKDELAAHEAYFE